jgi:hypothetical protein
VAALKVLDREPHRWFLLEDSGNLLLDVNCNHSFIGYTFLIVLSHKEADEYQSKGRAYLDWLSEDIDNSAPILKTSTSIYKGRDLTRSHGKQVIAAIDEWRSENPRAAN